jgi:hypothetical protein
MAKRFAYYYLQFNSGATWETLEQSESVAVLTSGLADQLASPTDAEIRIVGANFDQRSESWAYEQLFYIDQSSIDLGISDEHDGEDPGAVEADYPGRLGMSEADQAMAPTSEPEDGDEPGPAITALMRERDDIGAADEHPSDDDEPAAPWLSEPSTPADEDSARPWGGFDDADEGASRPGSLDRDDDENLDEPVPWLRQRGEAADTELDASEPFRFDTTPPKRRVSIGKIIGFVVVVLFLAAWVAVGALVYLQHPLLLDTADKLGIGEYLRMGDHADGSGMDSHGSAKGSREDTVPRVEPLTTGQVVRYPGVAPALRGRWSPRKCETTFIEFDEDGYNRSIGGQASAGKTEISETLEDDFVFYLRRSSEMVEHFRKVTANDIQLAGATTEGGFLGSSGKVEIYSRCP